MKKHSKKTIIIGLDGVPYSLIKSLTMSGAMPYTKKLVENGTLKRISSVLPEVSSVAWSSIITGENPGRHGVFGFTELSKDTYALRFPNINDLRSLPFWDKHSALKCAIINVPSTYPARSLNGVMISGFVSPVLERSVYPAGLIDILKEMGYETDVDSNRAHTDMDCFVEDLFSNLGSHLKLCRYLLSRDLWDVFMYVFTGTDRLMHFLWAAYDEEDHPYRAAFIQYFTEVDRAIAEICASLETGDTLLMFSDHGFERLRKDIFLNRLLEENGFFTANGEDISTIDSRTKAFVLDPSRIYIHTEGVYRQGGVKPDDKEAVMKELENILADATVDGRKVVKKIYRKEEVYSGPSMDSAPDIVLLAEDGFNLRASLSSKAVSADSIFTGKHTYRDTFFLTNNAAFADQAEDYSVIDVGKMIEESITR